MDVIDMMFRLFSDEIDNISLDSDLIGDDEIDDEMWDSRPTIDKYWDCLNELNI